MEAWEKFQEIVQRRFEGRQILQHMNNGAFILNDPFTVFMLQ